MDFPISVPSIGLVDGKFVDEDPLAGTPGSLIPSAWGNSVTEEILNVISEAGLTPDEEDKTQLKAAIVLIIGNHAPTELATQVEAETGTNNTKWMSPLRVFQAISKVVAQATETVFGWAKVATQAQVTTGTDDATIVTPKKLRGAQATQVEAEAGIDNSKVMTPLRVFQAIAAVVVQATETVFGWAKIATQTQVNAGVDDTTIITPKKLAFGFVFSPGTNGYIKFPSWLGGFILQWGSVAVVTTNTVVTLPTAFPNAIFGVVGSDNDSVAAGYVAWQPLSLTQIRGTTNGTFGCFYLAFGH